MKRIATLAAAGTLLAVLAAAQPSHYSVTDLGPVGPGGQPLYVSNNSLVGGATAVTGGAYHAVVWYQGRTTDLGAFGGTNSYGYGVNVKTQVVGWAETSEQDPYGEDFCGFGSHLVCLPFVSQFGLMAPLPTLGGRNGSAAAINGKGQVAGYSETSAWDPACPAPQKFQFKPVLWTKGIAQELPTVAGDPDGIAYRINENGQVVGSSGICAGLNPLSGLYLHPLHALLWEHGIVTDLGNLGGTGHGNGNTAESINNQGLGGGSTDLRGDKTLHAFLCPHRTVSQALGTRPGDGASLANANHDGGDVVGVSLDNQFNPRAFVVQNGVMSDLNALVPADSPLYLWTGCSINSSGDIIGIASASNGDLHGYLATRVAGAAGGPNTSALQPGAKAEHAPVTVPENARKLLFGLGMQH